MDLYQEHILDHYQHPRKRGRLEQPTGSAEVLNPLCGDRLVVDVRVDAAQHVDLAHEGEGCSISQASASLLAEYAAGKSVEELRAFTSDDLQKLLGVPLSPTRLRCALLSLEALHAALEKNGN